ncbi:hypothetical protein CTI12_AA542860 [Artemisia annua]|uniref:Uncharacterized protein n=1 Tax=Artemisia annua TaxID=35608 RepID=A0A2U1L0R4_ARTAN|nr:hypothetical protein CTI12_AA542860 [Artemisia annua]
MTISNHAIIGYEERACEGTTDVMKRDDKNASGQQLTISQALATAMEHLTKISSQCMTRQFEVIQAQYLDFKLGSYADEGKNLEIRFNGFLKIRHEYYL